MAHHPDASNPHFNYATRAPYELGNLLGRLPPGFAAFGASQAATAETLLIAEAAAQHAENANDTLMAGMEAIGHLLVQAGLSDECEIDKEQVTALGGLITHLAVESQFLQATKNSMRRTVQKHKASLAPFSTA